MVSPFVKNKNLKKENHFEPKNPVMATFMPVTTIVHFVHRKVVKTVYELFSSDELFKVMLPAIDNL